MMYFEFFYDATISDLYIRQVNAVKLADIMFSLCVSVCTQSHWFEWAEWRIVYDWFVKS